MPHLEFTDYKEWKAAVLAAGLSVDNRPSSTECPTESDAYEPVEAYKPKLDGDDPYDGPTYGLFFYTGADEGEPVERGVLFTDPNEFQEWAHAEEPN